MFTSILVPYDKSEHAKRALETALEIAEGRPGAKITVLYVTDLPQFDDATFEAAAQISGTKPMGKEDILALQHEYYETQRKAIIEDAAPTVEGHNIELLYRITSGRPHEAIAEYADLEQTDLIVMGRRGLGAVRGMLGSVSYAVLRSVDLPVLMIK